jgi:S1-C subfamily serine protease
MAVWTRAILLCVSALGVGMQQARAQVPGNVTSRVFEVRFNREIGTAFIVDYGGRQYIVTANHVMIGANSKAAIDFRAPNDSQWHSLEVAVFHGDDACADVAVLVPPITKITDTEPVPLGHSDSYFLGQEAYFLGFPYGLYTSFVNNTHAVPLVKHAYVSATVACSAVERNGSEKDRLILLDGLNNPGFSGGPVVAPDLSSSKHQFRFIGVIRGFRPDKVPLNTNGQSDPNSTVATNSGIMVVIPIDRVEELIRQANGDGHREPQKP